MPRMYEPVIEGKYKVTGDTRAIPIVVEYEEDEIQWGGSTSTSMDAVEPDTLKEPMTKPSGNLWQMSEISEVKTFLSRKAWILIKIRTVKSKCRNPVRA